MDRRNRDRGKKRTPPARPTKPTRAVVPETSGGILVACGDYADVWLFGEAREEYEALLARKDEKSIVSATQLPRYFERYASDQPLGDQMFKPVGRFGPKGNEAQVYEFKSWKFRIYGVVKQFRGKRCFVGTACDPYKKQNKADQTKLKNAAAIAEEIN
ncbi:hypothetical protein [Mesorhizobium sp. WSM3224]|uniref:hypothetical protein n=1 Tax=Mesorhizobium sp. WSM3224 TaxID=1040986 RepID=UPI0012EBAFF7|nr:hypothetical protein [Mesorhizobium sp. WSM3224]